MNKVSIEREKQAAVARLAALEQEIADFLATREDVYKNTTEEIKVKVAEFSKGLYTARRDAYHAVAPMKQKRTDIARIIANCDEAIW